MMGIDQARHDDMARGVNDLGIIRLQGSADCGDATVLDQDVAHGEIGNLGIQRQDGAAFEKSALRSHGMLLGSCGGPVATRSARWVLSQGKPRFVTSRFTR
ncbi:uncharacterized protein BCN122_II0064 [Burkholderia cenocepacia]|nr:uncharacterized protein BCN122_II0064 [Burkholderia cenocepacia]